MRRVLSIWLEGPEAITPETKKSLLSALLPWAYSFSPMVALDIPTKEDGRGSSSASSLSTEEFMGRYFFGINLDITGCSRLFESEEKLLKKAKKDLASLDFPVRLAIAPTLGAAWAISRFGKHPANILSPQGLKTVIPKLPIAALRLPLKTLRALKELEISIIADLLCLPRASLLSRFGAILLKRIDQAFGQEEEPLISEIFSAPLRVQKTFPSPITEQEPLMLCTKKLLWILLRRLVEAEQNLSVLEFTVNFVSLERASTPVFKKIIPFSVPTQNGEHIWSLLNIQCEKIDVVSGIDEISLRAIETTLVRPKAQPYLAEKSETTALSMTTIGPLVDILKAHLSENGIRKLQAFQSHLPEKSFRYLPLDGERKQIARPLANIESLLQTERPSLLFHRPSPARAMALMPDSPPFWIEWKNMAFKIVRGLGPERIAPEWWGKDEELMKTRDYFKVQTVEGDWLWVFRENESQQWFVHGLWA